MMYLSQFINKNNGLCVSCVCLCVSFRCNGTHAKAFNINDLSVNVYHVYVLFYTRMRDTYVFTFLIYHQLPLMRLLSIFNKISYARKYFINGTHGKHFIKSLMNKSIAVFTIFKNANHDSKHHKHLVEFE